MRLQSAGRYVVVLAVSASLVGAPGDALAEDSPTPPPQVGSLSAGPGVLPDGTEVTGRLLVKFERGTTARKKRAALAQSRTVAAGVHRGFLKLAAADLGQAMQDLARADSVRWVEPEIVYSRLADFPQPERIEMALPAARDLASAYGETFTGAGVTIAIIDDGIDSSNPDLIGRVSAGTSACGTDSITPSGWHGTAVAGLAAAADDGQNLTGPAPAASVRSYKVFCSAEGGAASSAVADALANVARDMAAAMAAGGLPWVVNMSLGDRFESRAVQEGIDSVNALGGTVVAAAGNDGGEQPNFPAGGRHVLSVGATQLINGAWRVAPFSPGGAVDVLAPGADVAAWRSGTVRRVTGTSFAAPQVSGVVAALLARGVGGTAVRALVAATTSAPHAGARYAAANGTGRVNAFRAYQVWVGRQPFSAAFPVGGAVLPTAGAASVPVEVLRYDPDPGVGHDAPAPLRANTAKMLVAFYPTPLRGAMPSTVDARGGLLWQHRGNVRTVSLPEGASSWIASGWPEDVTHRHPMHVVAKSNSPYGFRVQPGQTATSTLTYGVRSQLITKIGAFAGDEVEVFATVPGTIDLGSADAAAGLCVWEPWDVNGDGVIDSPGTDDDTQASYLPLGCYEGGGNDVDFTFVAPATGIYLVGIVTASELANGKHSVKTVVRTPRTSVRAPSYSMPTRVADGYGYRYRVAAATLTQRAETFEIQSATRRRTASGRWINSGWRSAGRLAAPLVEFPLVAGAKPGNTYLLRARTTDKVGNRGPWSAVARTDVPLDDNSPHLAWSRSIDRITCPVNRTAATRSCYGPGATGTARAGRPAVMSLSTDTQRFAVFATRCPRCGSLRISIDGRYRTTVSLRSATTRYRQMVYSTGQMDRTPQPHRLQLAAVTSASRHLIQIDAIRLTR